MRLSNFMSFFKRDAKVAPMESIDSVIPNETIENSMPISGNKIALEESTRDSTSANKVVSIKEHGESSKDNLMNHYLGLVSVDDGEYKNDAYSIESHSKEYVEGAREVIDNPKKDYGYLNRDNLMKHNLGLVSVDDGEYKNDTYSIESSGQEYVDDACEDILNDGSEKGDDNEWRQIIKWNFTCLSDLEELLKCNAKFNDKVEFILKQIIESDIDIQLEEMFDLIKKIMKPTIANQNPFNLREYEQLTLLSIIYHILEPFLSDQLIENQKGMIHGMVFKPSSKDKLIAQLNMNNYQEFRKYNYNRSEFTEERRLRDVLENKYLKD